MGLLQSIFFAFIQAATEFLPVSSSGHLLFLKGLLHIEDVPVIFDIVLHVGSLTAILLFYFKRIIGVLKQARIELHGGSNGKPNVRFLLFLVISTIITFGCYLLFRKTIEAQYQSPSILFGTYLVTTIILLSTFFCRKSEKQSSVSEKGILLPIVVGFFQGLAILPGISRSGATISPLLHWKINKEDAAFYSFFLAIPAILGALVFKLFELENTAFLKESWPVLAVSFIASVLFSAFFLGLLRFILKRDKFWLFAIYTLGMAIAALIVF